MFVVSVVVFDARTRVCVRWVMVVTRRQFVELSEPRVLRVRGSVRREERNVAGRVEVLRVHDEVEFHARTQLVDHGNDRVAAQHCQ